MWTWTLVRFVHLAAAATWLGMQVTLLVLVPDLRRRLPADEVRAVVRGAGRSLAIAGGTALVLLAASGFALSRHSDSAAAHPGVIELKEALLVAIVALLASHVAVRGTRARIAASALMLAAFLAGAWLAES
jgi:hypothetical protein